MASAGTSPISLCSLFSLPMPSSSCSSRASGDPALSSNCMRTFAGWDRCVQSGSCQSPSNTPAPGEYRRAGGVGVLQSGRTAAERGVGLHNMMGQRRTTHPGHCWLYHLQCISDNWGFSNKVGVRCILDTVVLDAWCTVCACTRCVHAYLVPAC